MTLGFTSAFSGQFRLQVCNGSSSSSGCNAGTTANANANGRPNAPVGGVCNGSGSANATVAWSPPPVATIGARSVTSYQYSGSANGTTGGTSFGVSFPADGGSSSYSIVSIDAAGETSASGITINCAHPPVPNPPSATIVLSKGSSAFGRPGCVVAACAFLFVRMDNFPANTRINLRCWSNEPNDPPGYFYTTEYVQTDSAGRFVGQLTCYFGYINYQVRVDSVNPAVQSNTVTW